MGLHRTKLLWFLAGLVFSPVAGGRSAMGPRTGRQFMPFGTPPQSNVVEFDLKYDFSIPGQTQAMSCVVLIPRSIPGRQKILSRKYWPKPSRIFHKNGNHYAEFTFRKPQRHERVKIRIKAELFRYDLTTARAGDLEEPLGDSQAEDFLTSERYIECDDDEIRQIAKDIDGDSELDVVKGIYDHVIDYMDYVIRGEDDKGALVALELGKGDCTEYSDLFVAICRAKNIPARVVTGYTVTADVTKSKHNWAEVYMQDCGWVPIDPTAGDMAGARFRNMAFGRIRPAYIYFSHVRNDHVLDNHNFGAYKYWGDKVRITDSIEFRFPDQSTANSR